jgi:hypothetical protein
MEMMEPDAADIMMGRFYEIDHSKLPLIPRDARRKRFLERAELRRIRVVKVELYSRIFMLYLVGVCMVGYFIVTMEFYSLANRTQHQKVTTSFQHLKKKSKKVGALKIKSQYQNKVLTA